eukprot:3893136-Alexandrium_andersonii.AAC.1
MWPRSRRPSGPRRLWTSRQRCRNARTVVLRPRPLPRAQPLRVPVLPRPRGPRQRRGRRGGGGRRRL